jgi:hypothetical protein
MTTLVRRSAKQLAVARPMPQPEAVTIAPCRRTTSLQCFSANAQHRDDRPLRAGVSAQQAGVVVAAGEELRPLGVNCSGNSNDCPLS